MEKSILEYHRYQTFLGDWIKAQPKGGHGIRKKMAEAIQRQSVFISQVLHGDALLSLSQAQTLAGWMGLGRQETHFFMLLLEKERADTPALRGYFEEQMEAIREQNRHLRHRIEGQSGAIPEKDRLRYYSAWYYGAIRILTAVPGFHSREAISRRLQLPLDIVTSTLEFLAELGLVEQKGDQFHITSQDIFLGNDSHLISRHHSNWRLRAMQSLDRERTDEIHYSHAVVISVEDAARIKQQLMTAIEANRKLVANSGSEELFCVCLDFFRV